MFQTNHPNEVAFLGTVTADRRLGRQGDDYLNGYGGNDRLFGRAGNDRLFGGSGGDWLDGGSGNDQLFGGSGNDRLLGDGGDDRLDGGSDRDFLTGGKGDDILIDRDGGDRLTGGKGNDQFWIGNGSLGSTTITDFQVGRDRLKLLDATITYNKLKLRESGEGTIITYQGHDLAKLAGVKAKQLTTDQFDFVNAKLVQNLQTTMPQIVAASGTPGATVSITFSDGTSWTGAAGLADLAAETAMKIDDRFNIGSITKIFTSTVILQLTQEGKLTLNDTLDQWLPDIAKSITNGRQITIQDLLAHTSGIPDYLNDQPSLTTDLAANLSLATQPWPLETILANYIYGKPSKFAPGTTAADLIQGYSNTNYLLLGKIIATATHESVEQQFQSRIFTPLGMHNTFYQNPSQIPGGTTHGYIDADGDGKIDPKVDIDTFFVNILDIENAAGAIVSTAADINRFTQGLLAGELLSPERFQKMTTAIYPGYGLGIVKSQLPSGETVLGHSGSGIGWSGHAYTVSTGATIAVFTNNALLPSDPKTQLLNGLFEVITKDIPSLSVKPAGN
jgi:CubicO group peptidase (beta-lactamase class C family)